MPALDCLYRDCHEYGDVNYGFVKNAFGDCDSNPCLVADAGGSYGRMVCRLIDLPCDWGNT